MRIVRFLLFILAAFVILWLFYILLFGGSKSNNSSSNSSTSTSSPMQQFSDSASTAATVSFTNDGVINGNDQHRQIKIVISSSARTITIYQGYQNQIQSSQSFPNNVDAYQDFLEAIYNSGFTTQKKNTASGGPQSQCPLGYRYIYNSTDIANVPDTLWTTTCGTRYGNFGGNASQVNSLFRLQIPNYSTIVNGVSLN